MKPIIIIGNGVAGVTAARELRKRDTEVPIIIISGETDHHFSRTALMYIFMGHMNYMGKIYRSRGSHNHSRRRQSRIQRPRLSSRIYSE